VDLFKSILCVVSADETAGLTVERAASVAANNQARLTLASVVPRIAEATRMPDGEHPSPGELQASMAGRQLQALESLAASHRSGLDIRVEVLVGDGFLEIIRAVLRNGHDLVIKPAENPGWTARLFGSDDMHLLRKCPCPVWLTKPGEKVNYGCILVAVDIGFESENALEGGLNRRLLELASSLALSDFAALHVVHAWEAIGEAVLRAWSDKPELASMRYVEAERSRHEAAMEQLRMHLKANVGEEAYAYLAPGFHLQRGAATRVIPELAQRLQADLVVMGTLGRVGISGLFIGNTAEAILEQIRCSVLAIKPPGFVSPVTLADRPPATQG
jgi:nucleotide-binding universal stress UspA family protein